MKRPPTKSPSIERQLAKAKVAGFELGLRAGTTIAAMLVEEGWKDLDRLPDAVCSRVTGKKLRRVNRLEPGLASS
jgi:hypothetical protein